MDTSMLRTRWAAIGAAVAVTLGAGGLVTAYATNPAGAVAFVPITPCRIADTRPAPDNVGARIAPIGPGETFTITAHGSNGNCVAGSAIPATATGLQLNVTALGATAGTFLTVWAQGAAQPTASNLNPQPGAPPIPNSVTTGLSGTGQFNIFNAAGFVNVVVDVVGYYADHDHDDRYLPKVSVLTYTGSNTDNTIGFDYELLRTVGDLTKQTAGSVLKLEWNSHSRFVGTEGTSFCHFQLRIDGRATDGDSSAGYQNDQGGTAVTFSSNDSVSATAIFPGLAAGTHTVQIWVRGTATSCNLNSLNFVQQVIATEFDAAPGSDLQ